MIYPNEAELSFNKNWLFLQFRIYKLNFNTMKSIISNLEDGNHSPLPFNVDNTNTCYFTLDLYSNRTKHCILLKIEITDKQYNQLIESNLNCLIT
jgi:hypothetical protein